MRISTSTRLAFAAALLVGCGSVPLSAWAQSSPLALVSAEVTTDQRERGLSWSDAKPAASLAVRVPATDRLTVDVEALTTRDSVRHGGANFAVTAAPRYALTRSAVNVGVGAKAHAFMGRTGSGKAALNYIELTSDLDYTFGPVRLGLGAAYVPSQAAIGGDNLYFSGNLEGGIPGTPFTVFGGLGYTTGDDGKVRSTRLRPGGDYSDHHVGVEYRQSILAVGLRYSDTSIRKRDVDFANPYADRHYGARLAAYVRLTP